MYILVLRDNPRSMKSGHKYHDFMMNFYFFTQTSIIGQIKTDCLRDLHGKTYSIRNQGFILSWRLMVCDIFVDIFFPNDLRNVS